MVPIIWVLAIGRLFTIIPFENILNVIITRVFRHSRNYVNVDLLNSNYGFELNIIILPIKTQAIAIACIAVPFPTVTL